MHDHSFSFPCGNSESTRYTTCAVRDIQLDLSGHGREWNREYPFSVSRMFSGSMRSGLSRKLEIESVFGLDPSDASRSVLRPWCKVSVYGGFSTCYANLVLPPKAIDFELNGITRLQILRRLHPQAHARGGTCRNQVSRLERHEMRKILDQIGYIEDHRRSISLLTKRAVHTQPHA